MTATPDFVPEHPVARINTARCSGCGRCISACDLRLFVFETHNWRKRAVLQAPDQCSGCGVCVARCSTGALEMMAVSAADAQNCGKSADSAQTGAQHCPTDNPG